MNRPNASYLVTVEMPHREGIATLQRKVKAMSQHEAQTIATQWAKGATVRAVQHALGTEIVTVDVKAV